LIRPTAKWTASNLTTPEHTPTEQKFSSTVLSTYEILLIIKVMLFAGMLVLAAMNRFQLGPLLERSLREGEYRVTANALRRSVLVELSKAILIVELVAWLGTLSPDGG